MKASIRRITLAAVAGLALYTGAAMACGGATFRTISYRFRQKKSWTGAPPTTILCHAIDTQSPWGRNMLKSEALRSTPGTLAFVALTFRGVEETLSIAARVKNIII